MKLFALLVCILLVLLAWILFFIIPFVEAGIVIDGSGGNLWSGNVTLTDSTQNGDDDNDIVIGIGADYFNRGNNSNEGAEWDDLGSSNKIENEHLLLVSVGIIYLNMSNISEYTISYVFNDDYEPVGDNSFETYFYLQDNSNLDNGYCLKLYDYSDSTYLYEYIDDSYIIKDTTLSGGAGGISLSDDDVIRITISSGSLHYYLNGVYRGQLDMGTNFTSGWVGFNPTNNDTYIDDFRVSNTTYANITRNYTAEMGESDELQTLSYNGSEPNSMLNVNLYASVDGISYVLIQSNASTNTGYNISGNGYEYARLNLNTTKISYTPIIYNITGTYGDSEVNNSVDIEVTYFDRTNLSYNIIWNVTNITEGVQYWNVSYSATDEGNTYYFRYWNDTYIGINQTAGSNNETLWFNSSVLLPEGVYYLSEIEDIDTTLPASITGLTNDTSILFYHNWSWTNPIDADFNGTMIYINNNFVVNVSNSTTFYNFSASAHNESTISTHTYNMTGNTNLTWVNHTSIIQNNNPTLSGLPDNNTNEDTNLIGAFDLDDFFTDVDNDSPTYQVQSNNASGYVTITIQGDNTVDYILSANWNGFANVVFNVSDGYGGTDTDIIILTVTAVNDSPVMDAIGDKSVNENVLLSIDVNATDIELDTLIYATNATYGSINSVTGVYTWTPNDLQTGVYSVLFNVTDGNTVDSEIITITVNEPPTAPSITSQLPTKTNPKTGLNENISFTLTADQAITTWTWLVDGIDQNNNDPSLTTSWSSKGQKSVVSYGTNANGTTYTITWYPYVIMAMASAVSVIGTIDNPGYDTVIDELGEEAPDFEVVLYGSVSSYITVLGNMAFLIIFGLPFIMMWIRQESMLMPSIFGLIFGVVLFSFMPAQFVATASAMIVLSIMGIIYVFYKERR